jgi:hypothetical protein
MVEQIRGKVTSVPILTGRPRLNSGEELSAQSLARRCQSDQAKKSNSFLGK